MVQTNRFTDRRSKLLPCQMERLKQMHQEGTTYAELERIFKLAKGGPKRICYPEQHKAKMKQIDWTKYRYPEQHRKLNQEHRLYKKRLKAA